MFPFDPPENIRKPTVFQEDQKGILGRKELKQEIDSRAKALPKILLLIQFLYFHSQL